MYVLDAASGAYLWNYPTNGAVSSSPAVANGKVYVGSYDVFIYAFGLRDRAPECNGGFTAGPNAAESHHQLTECHEARIILQQRLSKPAWTKEVDR